MLLQEHSLMARLRSLKSYFLLNEGDFLLQFMDLTEDEMKMNVEGKNLLGKNKNPFPCSLLFTHFNINRNEYLSML